jgi:hypothetical protein
MRGLVFLGMTSLDFPTVGRRTFTFCRNYRPSYSDPFSDLLALAGNVGFEFGTAAPNGWGTGKAPEYLDSAKTALGLIHFLLSLVLSWHCLGTGQATACQTKGRKSGFRNRAGHALTGQYLGRPLIWLSPAHFQTFNLLNSG